MQKVIGLLALLALPVFWGFRTLSGTLDRDLPGVERVTVGSTIDNNSLGEGTGAADEGEAVAKEEVNWMSLADAEKEYKRTGKTVLIDLYTDWCGWCKVMDKQTYSNAKVAKYINEHFLPVKLNAETKEVIRWGQKEYAFQANYRTNAFAIYLTQGKLSYPTTVFIPSVYPDPQAVPGFLEPKDIESLLRYFGDGHYGKTPFQDYIKNFTASWK